MADKQQPSDEQQPTREQSTRAARRGYRGYSDTEIAAALAAVAANGGNISKTAAQLGIPSKTLTNWVAGRRRTIDPQAVEELKEDLASQFEELAFLMLGVARDKASKLGARDATVCAAIGVDKCRLLREQPTEIVRTRADVTTRIDQLTDQFDAALRGAIARERADEISREETGAPPSDDRGESVDPGSRQDRPILKAS